jgi:hypothetical protein
VLIEVVVFWVVIVSVKYLVVFVGADKYVKSHIRGGRFFKVAAYVSGIYAVVAFPVPSVLVKDKMLICKTKAGNMHVSHHCINIMCVPCEGTVMMREGLSLTLTGSVSKPLKAAGEVTSWW